MRKTTVFCFAKKCTKTQQKMHKKNKKSGENR